SQVIEREPNRPALYFHRARMRLQARDPKDITPAQFAEAERDLQKAVQLNPGFSEARRRLSDLYLQQGRIDRALAELYALIDRDTRSSFIDRVRLANILMQNQQWPELTNVLQNGAQAFPTSSQWPFMQGQAAQMRQQFEIARQKYTEA